MEPIHIVIPGKPQVWSRPRVNSAGGRVIMFDPKDKERKKLGLWLKQFFPFPLEGPVKIQIDFFFAIKDKKKWGQFKTSKSDLDNLIKSAGDALNKVAFIDDAQVCSIVASKRWAETDATHLFISKL